MVLTFALEAMRMVRRHRISVSALAPGGVGVRPLSCGTDRRGAREAERRSPL